MAAFSRSIRINSSSEIRGGDSTAVANGEDTVLELEMLCESSSKGSERKRSSSDRKEVARGSSCPESDNDDLRGHEGKAQEAS